MTFEQKAAAMADLLGASIAVLNYIRAAKDHPEYMELAMPRVNRILDDYADLQRKAKEKAHEY